jgi:hypothetical protein
MIDPDPAYYCHDRFAEDVMRKHLAAIAVMLLAAAVLGIIAAAPLSLAYD